MNNADILIEKANDLQSKGNWGEALSLWNEIIRNQPQSQQAYLQAANCYFRLKQFAQALKAYNKCIKNWPKHPIAYLGKSRTLLRQRKTTEALVFLLDTTKKFPNHIPLQLCLISGFTQSGQLDLADALIQKISSENGSSPELEVSRLAVEKVRHSRYHQDGLMSEHNHSFMNDTKFLSAYARGLTTTPGENYEWYWRVHVGLWVAENAAKLNGDFVECGVNKGFMSSSIMHHLDWESLNKHFYLLDTFSGINTDDLSEEEKKANIDEANQERLARGYYNDDVEMVTKNFQEWSRVKIIKGAVPHTLNQIDSSEIAYLHIDMNADLPSAAALDQLWKKLTPGAFVLMDDYANKGYDSQKAVLDKVAKSKNHSIVSLPTGQGILIKSTAVNS